MTDVQRARRIAERMERDGYSGLVCRAPQNVLMLTGYLPVLGNSFCIASHARDGSLETRLVVPSDEADLVPEGSAVETRTFSEETLDYIGVTLEAAREPLGSALRSARLEGTKVGYEGGRETIAAAYTQVGVPGPNTLDLLRELLPGAGWSDASAMLNDLAAVKTDAEIERIAVSVEVAGRGFEAARSASRAGATESDVLAEALATMTRVGYERSRLGRVIVHAHVMAGARSADAYKAFNHTTNNPIRRGDPVLVQVEVCVDGYWAELTRTFFAGHVSVEWRRVAEACERASRTALEAIHDGVLARDADAAARSVLTDAGYAREFRHGLGHGVGFQAINHSAQPILHPVSDTVLRTGMVHNMEPAVYIRGVGGYRLNNDIVVRPEDAVSLSAGIPSDLGWLVTG